MAEYLVIELERASPDQHKRRGALHSKAASAQMYSLGFAQWENSAPINAIHRFRGSSPSTPDLSKFVKSVNASQTAICLIAEGSTES